MKKIITTLLVLVFVSSLVSASSQLNYEIKTKGDLSGNFNLDSDGDMNIYVNGKKLSNTEYVSKYVDYKLHGLDSGGNVQNWVMNTLRKMARDYQSGDIFKFTTGESQRKMFFFLSQVFVPRDEMIHNYNTLNEEIDFLKKRIEVLENQ